MKIDLRLYFILLFILAANISKGQSKISIPDDPVIFGDTVAQILNATRNEEAEIVGGNLPAVWEKLGADHKQKVIEQTQKMLEKRFRARPHLVLYFGALNYAVDIESLDNRKLNEYLDLTGLVLDGYETREFMTYLRRMKTFFENRALYYERSNKLYVSNDQYSFEYVTVEVPVEEEVTDDYQEEDVYEESDDEYFEEWDEEENEEDWDTDWSEEEDVYEEEEEDSGNGALDALLAGGAQPIVEGPVIKFSKVDLNIATPYDSAFLRNTSGSYMIMEDLFVGEGGRFDWTTAGLSADSVYADLTTYNFAVNKPILKAEQVKLTYKGRVKTPVDGVFEFRSIRHDSTSSATYPRFMSYYSDITVDNIGNENLTYQGGFALNGPKIFSSSVLGGFSTITVKGEGGKRFVSQSRLYELQDSTITAKRSRITIYQGYDSIFHPAVRFNFNTSSEFLTIQKDQGNFKNTPFTTSYFDVNIKADIVKWDVKTDSLDISILGGRKIVPAYFESDRHFNVLDYESLSSGVYDFNPLRLAVNYARKERSKEFYADDLARKYNRNAKTIRGAMVYLMQNGFIDYDIASGRVTMKRKAYHFINSLNGRKDFDNIVLESLTDAKSNATLDLKEGELTVRGVKQFTLSDSLDVFIEPDSSVVVLRQGRDIGFDGKIFAGNFEYIGRDFSFKYDSFLISLNQIDSIRFYVKDENSRGSGRKRVDNVLSSTDTTGADGATGGFNATSGTLFINKPNNKSGKVPLTNYPKFDAGTGAVVYFNRQEIFDGIYDRSVYFEVPPFAIDSLNDSDPAAIGFQGTFISSGMFPIFEEKLKVMPDFSLGFEHKIPEDGFQLFEGRGKLYGDIKLDKQGIRSKGKIDFLSTTVESEDFIFYPDSVVASGTNAEIRQEEFNGIIFPQATLVNFSMKWLPKQDSMYITNTGDPFRFYNNTATLDGSAIVSNNGVYGKGVLETRGSEAVSDELNFEHDRYSARHAKFEVKTDDPEKPALAGDDVRLNFNLTENYADISPEIEGEAAVAFPYAQFKTSITRARWDLESQKIIMTKPDNVPIENSYFYTTRKDLDSLRFNATEAEYDINTYELKVKGIPYIVVADAKVTPENNEVLVLENSQIRTLNNAVIVLDTLNSYHRLYDATVNITSRNEYTASATYELVNAVLDTFAIKMNDFRLESTVPIPEDEKERRKLGEIKYRSVANGNVKSTDKIYMSPGMIFKGDVILYADQPALALDGHIKLDIKRIKGYNTWIQFENNANQEEIVIDFDNSVTEDGKKLNAGLHFAASDNNLYSTFVFDKGINDDDFFTPSGELYFDPENNEYIIENPDKAAGNSYSGKVFKYNDNTEDITFEGPAQFMFNRDGANINAAVIGKGNLQSTEYDINSFMVVDFGLPATAFERMALDMKEVIDNYGAPEAFTDQNALLYKLAEIVGEKAAKQYEEQSLQEYVPLGTFNKAVSKPMVFSNIDFKWSQENKAFYSDGKLGLSNVLRTDLNAAFDGFMEIKRNEGGGTLLNIFIKAAPGSWYFFSYEDNRLIVHSSNGVFNDIIYKKSNAAKAKLGELVFVPGDKIETLDFINRFRRVYYDIDEPYVLESDVEDIEEVPEDGFGGVDDSNKTDDEEEDDDDGF
ncbi:MAG: hypothetical protein AAFX87_09660 [Bacteroidota bacterium]